MNDNIVFVFTGLLFLTFSFLLSGIGYMVYIKQSKIVAVCGIPLVFLVAVFGIYLIVKGFKND